MRIDEKACPQCAEIINAAAMTCVHCGLKLYEHGSLPLEGGRIHSIGSTPGRWFYWIGIVLIALSMLAFAGGHAGILDMLGWLGLFLAGVINLGVAGIIRAIGGQRA